MYSYWPGMKKKVFFFWILHMLMRSESIIIIDKKWYIDGSPLWRRSIVMYVCKHNLCRSSSSKHHSLLDFPRNSCEECNSLLIESFTFWDEDDYEYEIFSILSIEHMRTNIILVGKCDSHRHSTMGFSKNVVVAGTSHQVLSFYHFNKYNSAKTFPVNQKYNEAFWEIYFLRICEKTLCQISYS